MARHFLYFSLLLVSLVSCGNDDEKRRLENERDLKKQEAVFANISKAWQFNTQPINPTANTLSASWNEWRILLGELSQKPKSSIGAFRKKAKTLSLKVRDLKDRIPGPFNKPEVKARIAVLTTKINALNLFMSQDEIDDQKVIALISEINVQLVSLQMQMGEITRKSQIPKEEGEADMIRMLDTARAIPSKPAVNPVTPSSKPQSLRNMKRTKQQ